MKTDVPETCEHPFVTVLFVWATGPFGLLVLIFCWKRFNKALNVFMDGLL